jgi:dTDP-4-amino-4,6-dideoxygalactose transaminase
VEAHGLKSFGVVDAFERAVAEFSGSKYAVAVNTGTSAIFLCLKYVGADRVILPARTFVSVPMAVMHAGGRVVFEDEPWTGVYSLKPYPIVDGALRFRRGMYQGGLHCLSFHARKLLNIGEGGMILTDDADADKWLRKARYSGRAGPDYRVEDIDMVGWQCYMTPEKAARGLHLLEYIADDLPDQVMTYPDLRLAPVFA